MEKGSIFSDSLFWFAAGTCLMWVSAVLLVSGRRKQNVSVQAIPNAPVATQNHPQSLPQRIVVNIVCSDPYAGTGVLADMVVRLEDVLAGNYTVPEHLRPKQSPTKMDVVEETQHVEEEKSLEVDADNGVGPDTAFTLDGFDIDINSSEEPDFGYGPEEGNDGGLGLEPGLDETDRREEDGYVDLV